MSDKHNLFQIKPIDDCDDVFAECCYGPSLPINTRLPMTCKIDQHHVMLLGEVV